MANPMLRMAKFAVSFNRMGCYQKWYWVDKNPWPNPIESDVIIESPGKNSGRMGADLIKFIRKMALKPCPSEFTLTLEGTDLCWVVY